MGTLLSYSGISTKIRAMQSKHISDQQLEEIVSLTDISQVASYLKHSPEYAHIWESIDENTLHREDLEILLKQSVFYDFSKLYKFANSYQRRFLDLYAMRYEIRVLKELMRNIFDHRQTDPLDLSSYRDFFLKYSKLNLDKLIPCTTIEDLIAALKGNEFYVPMRRISHGLDPTVFDYGMALDLYYFTKIWNVRKKLFRGVDLRELTEAYGEKFDLLNVQFIQRSRKYFRMNPADVYSLLIPVNYRLSKNDIMALVEIDDPDMIMQVFKKTYYGKKYSKFPEMDLEDFYNYTLRTVLEKEARQNPHSIAILFSYMYHKEHEIDRLTTAIECVRYNIAPAEAMHYIRNN